MSRTTTSSSSSHGIGAVVVRWVLFLVLWLCLAGKGPDVATALFGAASAALATWISVVLLPPCPGASLPGVAGLALHLVRQTFKSGIEVAGLAFGPIRRMRPGAVPFRPSIAPGTLRDAFAALTSLVPGTLPIGEDDDGRILYHCLNVQQPVSEQLRTDERAVRRAFAASRAPVAPGDQIRRSGSTRATTAAASRAPHPGDARGPADDRPGAGPTPGPARERGSVSPPEGDA